MKIYYIIFLLLIQSITTLSAEQSDLDRQTLELLCDYIFMGETVENMVKKLQADRQLICTIKELLTRHSKEDVVQLIIINTIQEKKKKALRPVHVLIASLICILVYLLYNYKKENENKESPLLSPSAPENIQPQTEALKQIDPTPPCAPDVITAASSPKVSANLGQHRKEALGYCVNFDQKLCNTVDLQAEQARKYGIPIKTAAYDDIQNLAPPRGDKKFMQAIAEQIADAKTIGLEPLYQLTTRKFI